MTNGKHPHPAKKPGAKKPAPKASPPLTAKTVGQKLMTRPKKAADS